MTQGNETCIIQINNYKETLKEQKYEKRGIKRKYDEMNGVVNNLAWRRWRLHAVGLTYVTLPEDF